MNQGLCKECLSEYFHLEFKYQENGPNSFQKSKSQIRKSRSLKIQKQGNTGTRITSLNFEKNED